MAQTALATAEWVKNLCSIKHPLPALYTEVSQLHVAQFFGEALQVGIMDRTKEVSVVLYQVDESFL